MNSFGICCAIFLLAASASAGSTWQEACLPAKEGASIEISGCTSVTSCQQACEANSDCDAFAYSKDSSWFGPKQGFVVPAAASGWRTDSGGCIDHRFQYRTVTASESDGTGGTGIKLLDADVCDPACAAPTPICGANKQCTDTRWLEPISTLPQQWGKLEPKWTKWVRSIIPVIGQELTEPAALLEVAYFAEAVMFPGGQKNSPSLVDSMIGKNPTAYYVYPACPNAYMNPNVFPKMSSGSGPTLSTQVGEDWILQYPKCVGEYAVACNEMPLGIKCNNCGWDDPADLEPCLDTLSHEWGHTADLHDKRLIHADGSIEALGDTVFANPTEGPAWSASDYIQNPSYQRKLTRDALKADHPKEYSFWKDTHGIDDSLWPAGWGYKIKNKRCPNKGMTEPCADTLTRLVSVPLDDVALYPASLVLGKYLDASTCNPNPGPLLIYPVSKCEGNDYVSFNHSMDSCSGNFPKSNTAIANTKSMFIPAGMRITLWNKCVITTDYWGGSNEPTSETYVNHNSEGVCVNAPNGFGSVAFMGPLSSKYRKKQVWWDNNMGVFQCGKGGNDLGNVAADILEHAGGGVPIILIFAFCSMFVWSGLLINQHFIHEAGLSSQAVKRARQKSTRNPLPLAGQSEAAVN